jgi:nucleosome binding factor SPN SPT16 subunit
MTKKLRNRNVSRSVGLTSVSDISIPTHEQQLISELQEEVRRLRILESKLKSPDPYDDTDVRAEIESLRVSVNRYIRNLKALGFAP